MNAKRSRYRRFLSDRRLHSAVLEIILLVAVLGIAGRAEGFQGLFTPQLRITEQYSDNLFLDPENEQEDFLTIVSLPLEGELQGETVDFRLLYEPGYSFYAEFDENNAWRHKADAFFEKSFSPHTRVELQDRFIRTEDPVSLLEIEEARGDDTGLQPESGVRQTREPYYRNDAGVKLIHDFGPKNSVTVDYNYRILENDDETKEDNKEHRPGITLEYWVTQHIGMEADASFSRTEYSGGDLVEPEDVSDDFDNWEGSLRLIRQFDRNFRGDILYKQIYRDYDELRGDRDDYDLYDASAGVEWSPVAYYSMVLRGGYIIGDPKDGESRDEWSGELSVERTFRNASLRLTGIRGYNQSDFGSQNLGFETYREAGFVVNYTILQDLSANAYARYRESEFPQTGLEVDGEILGEREDETTLAGAGIRYTPTKWMTASLDYAYRNVRSTDELNQYEENRFTFSLTFYPETAYRFLK